MAKFLQSMRWRLMAAGMGAVLIVGGMMGSAAGPFGPQAAEATVSASGGTTDPNDLPGMACAKVKATWPGWTIKSYSLTPGAVIVGATNAKGTKASFTVQVVSRLERGRMTYYVGTVTGPY